MRIGQHNAAGVQKHERESRAGRWAYRPHHLVHELVMYYTHRRLSCTCRRFSSLRSVAPCTALSNAVDWPPPKLMLATENFDCFLLPITQKSPDVVHQDEQLFSYPNNINVFVATPYWLPPIVPATRGYHAHATVTRISIIIYEIIARNRAPAEFSWLLLTPVSITDMLWRRHQVSIIGFRSKGRFLWSIRLAPNRVALNGFILKQQDRYWVFGLVQCIPPENHVWLL